MFMLALIPGLLDTWKVNLSVSDFYIFWGNFCSLLGLMLGVQAVYHSFIERSDTSETKILLLYLESLASKCKVEEE